MRSPIEEAPAHVDAPRRKPAPQALPRLRPERWRKFLSYYRPHLGLLTADLACAILVSATALALPLLANYVIKRLALGGGAAGLMDQIWLVGAAMLVLLAVQALS